ncbi:MAG: DUF1801 domain-containing protein [Candidatus Doudnabacteria bacterium]
MTNEIEKYNKSLSQESKKIAQTLSDIINKSLPTAENKVWHGHPVWFIDQNPIVGYSQLKTSFRLMFWSGQSFKTKGLTPEGKFKAATFSYASSSEINPTIIKKWLAESKTIQWDYKNIVKRKGKLIKLSI